MDRATNWIARHRAGIQGASSYVCLKKSLGRSASVALPLDAARCRSMPLDAARRRSMPLDVARCRSMSLDVARSRSIPLDVARCRSMSLDPARCLRLNRHHIAKINFHVRSDDIRIQILLVEIETIKHVVGISVPIRQSRKMEPGFD